jgi:hypothetical protein
LSLCLLRCRKGNMSPQLQSNYVPVALAPSLARS